LRFENALEGVDGVLLALKVHPHHVVQALVPFLELLPFVLHPFRVEFFSKLCRSLQFFDVVPALLLFLVYPDLDLGCAGIQPCLIVLLQVDEQILQIVAQIIVHAFHLEYVVSAQHLILSNRLDVRFGEHHSLFEPVSLILHLHYAVFAFSVYLVNQVFAIVNLVVYDLKLFVELLVKLNNLCLLLL